MGQLLLEISEIQIVLTAQDLKNDELVESISFDAQWKSLQICEDLPIQTNDIYIILRSSDTTRYGSLGVNEASQALFIENLELKESHYIQVKDFILDNRFSGETQLLVSISATHNSDPSVSLNSKPWLINELLITRKINN